MDYQPAAVVASTNKPLPPLAHVRTFKADITLTPKLSVGTDKPESIYECRFSATLSAVSPTEPSGPCRIELPLPPQIISLAELNITANKDPSDDVTVTDGKLVWQGSLSAQTASEIQVTYAAVGKGIYTLEKPASSILDAFDTTLTANGSDVRHAGALAPTQLLQA